MSRKTPLTGFNYYQISQKGSGKTFAQISKEWRDQHPPQPARVSPLPICEHCGFHIFPDWYNAEPNPRDTSFIYPCPTGCNMCSNCVKKGHYKGDLATKSMFFGNDQRGVFYWLSDKPHVPEPIQE